MTRLVLKMGFLFSVTRGMNSARELQEDRRAHLGYPEEGFKNGDVPATMWLMWYLAPLVKLEWK